MTAQADPLARYSDAVRVELRSVASRFSHHALLRYHFGLDDESGKAAPLSGGALCLAVAEALGGEAASVLPIAVATELLQGLALIQADLHAASERRDGRPTLAKRHGVPLALNSEDGLFALAQVVLARLSEAGVAPETAVACQARFDFAVLRLCESLPAWGRVGDDSAAAEDGTDFALAFGTPLGAGVSAAALAAGVDTATADALMAYGEALGALIEIAGGPDAAAATDLKAAAAASVAKANLTATQRERLASLAGLIAGGRK